MPKHVVEFAGPSYFGGRNDELVLCAGKGAYRLVNFQRILICCGKLGIYTFGIKRAEHCFGTSVRKRNSQVILPALHGTMLRRTRSCSQRARTTARCAYGPNLK